MSNKINITSMAGYVARNPFTAAAALVAPLFARNEDRGYFRSALITTPVIFATSEFVPRMFGGVQGLAKIVTEPSSLIRRTRAGATPTYSEMSALFKDPNVPDNVLERNLAQYLVADHRSQRNLIEEQKSLTRMWNRKFVISPELIQKSMAGSLEAQARIAEIQALQSSKGPLVENALQYARRQSLTMEEWAEEVKPSWGESVPAMSNDQMAAMFDKYSTRPEFVKTLKNRLREVQKQSYSGTLGVAGGPPGTKVRQFPIEFSEFDDTARGAFATQAPEAYQNLEQAYSLGHVREVTVLSDDVVNGKVGRVLGVKVTRAEKGNLKELIIPVVDMKTGTVRLNENAIGVGDWVIDAEQRAHRLDSWISKMLVEHREIPIHEAYPGGPSLENEIAAHAYWHAGDPTDARRMAELESFGGESAGQYTAQARKLRSYAAKYSKLPIFPNTKGKQVTYSALTADEQQDVVRNTLNSNRFINMSSEAGTYEGRFVLREAAFLSPYGAPSAEKQDSIWRSVTKEFQLRAPEGLPEEARLGWRSTAWQELTGSANLPAAKFTTASIDPQVRTALIAEMKAAGREDVVASLGRMGETGFVMNEDFANNFTVEAISKYNVDQLGVKVGDTVSPETVMGFNNYDRVAPKHLGVVTDIARDETGFVINVKHELAMQGAKVDIAGIKGMVPATIPNEHFEQLRGIINEYYSRTGSGDFIPSSVTTLAPAEYFANKVEPTQAYLGMGGDLVTRLQGKPEAAESVKTYLGRMSSELGTEFEGGQLVINAAKLQSAKDIDAAARLRTLSDISEDFFRKAGDAIKSAGGYQDPVLTAYVNSGKELGDWMLKNQLPAMGFAWDHSLVNAPRFASFTHDIATHLALGQNVAGLKAISNRLVTSSSGDPRQSLDFMKYVMGGKFDQEMGVTIPLGEAFLERGSLNLAKNRAGTIFDPDAAQGAYRQNFRIDLGNGQFLPVPGTDAYMAEAKLYEPGKYQTRRWQHTLQDLAFETNAEKKAELQARVISQYKEEFATGKGSVLRPYEQDPLSIAGVMSTIAEEDNPFTARISRELAGKVRSKELREALLRGEEVMGALHRQPTNQMLYMKFKVDEAMKNTFDIGVAERISRAYIGDQDKDTVYALLFDANVRSENGKMVVARKANQLEADAATEAYEAINGGQQLGRLEAWERVMGTPEVANRLTDFKPKSLAGRMEGFATKVRNRVGVAINRTAGAAIGPYSNVLTEMTEHMVRNPAVLKNPKLGARLSAMMFEFSRQVPISARKAPSFSLEQAMVHLDRAKKAVANPNAESAAEKLHSAFMNLGKTINPNFEDTPIHQYLTEQAAEDLRVWARGRSSRARLMKEAFTATVDQARPFEEQFAAKNLTNIFSDVESTLGSVHGGRMVAATESASRLGMLAEGLSKFGRDTGASVTGQVGKIFKQHGKAMALGLGAMAALGVALTPREAPIATFSRASGNKFRPEKMAGVADSIPGEPVPGQMAPSRPPRRMVQGRAGVRTAVVTPMNQTSDLTVKMRATDQSRAAETARLMAQVPGSGDTNTTINYRDRTKLRSLRTREKIRGLR